MRRLFWNRTGGKNCDVAAAREEWRVVKQIVAAMFVALCTVAANAADETKTTTVTRALVIIEPSETKITSPADFAVYAAPANIVLAASYSSQFAYQVTFYNQGTYIGTGSSDTHTFTWENVPVGQYEITAYADDGAFGGAFSPPVHITVTGGSAPTVSVVATPDAATAPATIKFAATASDSDGTVSKVEFFNGTALLSTATHAPYEFNWANVGPGAYSITARATDNQGLTTTSAAVPVSVSTSGAKVYFVYTDQVNTPRAIIDAGGAQVWTSDGEPFGANAPNENPAGKGQFTFNLRFPGQYFDKETGLHYNYYRDYDPQTGRYVQSDPIGLDGGINTYAYVLGNPVRYTDPTGLNPALMLPGLLPPAVAPSTGLSPSKGLVDPEMQPLPSSRSPGFSLNDTFLTIAQITIAPMNALGESFAQIAGMCKADDESSRCRKVLQGCREACTPGMKRGSDVPGAYRKCVRRCMENQGCYDF